MVVPKIATMVVAALFGQIGMKPDQARADRRPVQLDHEQQRDIGEQRRVSTVRKRA